MKKGFIFSFTVDVIIMIILVILMWLVTGLSVDSIIESKEQSLDILLKDFEEISSTFVLINTKLEHIEPVYTCDLQSMAVIEHSRDGQLNIACPTNLRGVRYGSKITGVKK